MSDSSNTPINPQDMAADLAKNVDKAARKVVSLTDKGPIKGFKKFISRGSMIDMAVGVVMGSAVTTVVNSIVNHLISPLIGMIGGVPDMSGVLTITFNGATISFGAILNAIINFLLIGVAVYLCIVLPINKLRDMGANEEAEDTEPTTEEQTLADGDLQFSDTTAATSSSAPSRPVRTSSEITHNTISEHSWPFNATSKAIVCLLQQTIMWLSIWRPPASARHATASSKSARCASSTALSPPNTASW